MYGSQKVRQAMGKGEEDSEQPCIMHYRQISNVQCEAIMVARDEHEALQQAAESARSLSPL